MSKINSNTKDDFQVVFLLSCFVGHPVCLFVLNQNGEHIRNVEKNRLLSWVPVK